MRRNFQLKHPNPSENIHIFSGLLNSGSADLGSRKKGKSIGKFLGGTKE